MLAQYLMGMVLDDTWYIGMVCLILATVEWLGVRGLRRVGAEDRAGPRRDRRL